MKRTAQWVIYLLIMLAGFFALLLLCGEETPGKRMSDKIFFTSKIVGLAILYGCVKAWKYFNREGMLPDLEDPDDDDGWED